MTLETIPTYEWVENYKKLLSEDKNEEGALGNINITDEEIIMDVEVYLICGYSLICVSI